MKFKDFDFRIVKPKNKQGGYNSCSNDECVCNTPFLYGDEAKYRLGEFIGNGEKIKSRMAYLGFFMILSFYVVGFVYASMFAYSYENDVNVDFVVFTIEHYIAIFLTIIILPVVCGWLIGWLISPYCSFKQEDGIFLFTMVGGFVYVLIITIFALYTIDNDSHITKEQRDIIVDLVKQEKISKQSVKAGFYTDYVEKEGGGREIGKVMDINRVPIEFYVCFEKGFNSPICAKLFENFLVKEKEEVRREKAMEALDEQNKQKAIESYNRIVEKVK